MFTGNRFLRLLIAGIATGLVGCEIVDDGTNISNCIGFDECAWTSAEASCDFLNSCGGGEMTDDDFSSCVHEYRGMIVTYDQQFDCGNQYLVLMDCFNKSDCDELNEVDGVGPWEVRCSDAQASVIECVEEVPATADLR